MLAIALICATLAVYRLSFMITREEGPFDVFERLRLAAQTLPSSPDGRPNRLRPHWIARGIACPLCVSFWLSLIAAFLVTQVVGLPAVAAFGLWLPVAGACLFLFQIGGT
jgi:hypothetical protein